MTDKDLTAAQLGEALELTERQVKDRVAKGIFICHWRGGTDANPRSMRFTQADVDYNREVGASATVRTVSKRGPASALDPKVRKGVARMLKAGAVAR